MALIHWPVPDESWDHSQQIEVFILPLIVGPPVETAVRADGAIAVISAAIEGTVLEDTGS